MKGDTKINSILRYDSSNNYLETLTFKKLFSIEKCATLGIKYLSLEGIIFDTDIHNIEYHLDEIGLNDNLVYKAIEKGPLVAECMGREAIDCNEQYDNYDCDKVWGISGGDYYQCKSGGAWRPSGHDMCRFNLQAKCQPPMPAPTPPPAPPFCPDLSFIQRCEWLKLPDKNSCQNYYMNVPGKSHNDFRICQTYNISHYL